MSDKKKRVREDSPKPTTGGTGPRSPKD